MFVPFRPLFPATFALLVVSTTTAVSAEPEPWLVVDVHRPARLLRHELVTSVRSALAESPDFRDRQRTPELERVRGLLEFVENALGVEWESGLDRLVRRARLQGFDPDRPMANVLVVESDSRETQVELLNALAKRIPPLGPLAEQVGSGAAASRPVRIGPLLVAVDGARILVSGDESLLKRVGSETLPAANDADLVLSARLNVDRLRDRIEAEEAFAFPHRDPGAVATVGGWLARIRNGRELHVELRSRERGLEVSASLISERTGDVPRIGGFFAPADSAQPTPLRPTGTIFAASWYRDYARLWADRDELLEAEVVERMEERDGEVRDELKVLGLNRLPSEVVGMLGTDYHVVVMRGESPDYDVHRDERLPMAAVAISLRDEQAFRETFEPVFKVVGLILAGEQKMLVKQAPHGDAVITTARYRDDRGSRESGNALRYHFAPSWTVARGHVVVGSTRRSVATVLEEIERKRSTNVEVHGNREAAASENGFVSFREAAVALQEARPLLVGRAQLEEGISSRRADTELRVARTILEALGSATIRTSTDDTTINVTLVVGHTDATK